MTLATDQKALKYPEKNINNYNVYTVKLKLREMSFRRAQVIFGKSLSTSMNP